MSIETQTEAAIRTKPMKGWSLPVRALHREAGRTNGIFEPKAERLGLEAVSHAGLALSILLH
jgi:hypothetical protein